MAKADAVAVTRIAQVIHEATRAWQKANGQDPAPAWSRAPKWMKDASVEAVAWRLANPDAPASAQHDRWMTQKRDDGWAHGRVKSGVKKTHPMIVPYRDLPDVERRKDALVNSIIDALAGPMR